MPSTVDLSQWFEMADEDMNNNCVRKVADYIRTEKVSRPAKKYAAIGPVIGLESYNHDTIIQYQDVSNTPSRLPEDTPVDEVDRINQSDSMKSMYNLMIPITIVNVFRYSQMFDVDLWALVIGDVLEASEKKKVYKVSVASNLNFVETLLRIHNFCVFLLEGHPRFELYDDCDEYSHDRNWADIYRFERFKKYCQKGQQYFKLKMTWAFVEDDGERIYLEKVREQITGKNRLRCKSDVKGFTTAAEIVREVEIGDLIEFERCNASTRIPYPYTHWAVVVGRFRDPSEDENNAEDNVYIVHYAYVPQENNDSSTSSGSGSNIFLRFDKLNTLRGWMRINNLHDTDVDMYDLYRVEDECKVLTRVTNCMERNPEYDLATGNCENMAVYCRYGIGISVQGERVADLRSAFTLGFWYTHSMQYGVYLAEFIYVFLVYLFSRQESSVMLRTGVLVGTQSYILLAVIFSVLVPEESFYWNVLPIRNYLFQKGVFSLVSGYFLFPNGILSCLGSGSYFLFCNNDTLYNNLKLVLVVSVLSFTAFKSGEIALTSVLGICYVAIASLSSQVTRSYIGLWSILENWVTWLPSQLVGELGSDTLWIGYQNVLGWLRGRRGTLSTHEVDLPRIVVGFKDMLMHVVVLTLLSYTAFRSGLNNFMPGLAVIFIVIFTEISADSIVAGFDCFANYCLYGKLHPKKELERVYVDRGGITLSYEFSLKEKKIPFPSSLIKIISFTHQLITSFCWWEYFAVESKHKIHLRDLFITVIFGFSLTYVALAIGPEFAVLISTMVLHLQGKLSPRCAAYILLATLQSFLISFITLTSPIFFAVHTNVVQAFVVVLTYVVLAVTLFYRNPDMPKYLFPENKIILYDTID